MLAAYLDILTYVPGSTNATQHVMLSDNKPVVVRRYPLPLHFEDAVKRKLTWLLNTNIVEHANWKYSSPILPVLKLDGPLRLCVDYRKLNQVTLVQQELMPEPDNTFPRIARARFFFTQFDLTRGYLQSKLHPDCKNLIAFSSPLGQLQWKVLDFGLASVPSTFTKLMRQLIHYRDDIVSYLVYILVFHANLSEHIRGVNSILEGIRKFVLTIRPHENIYGREGSYVYRVHYKAGWKSCRSHL